jgi:hypothetical protein
MNTPITAIKIRPRAAIMTPMIVDSTHLPLTFIVPSLQSQTP